ncbi:MAG: hypothetical protein U0T69_03775 [Chitinophagales bacterium]
MAKKTNKAPKEASILFHNIMKASVKPKPVINERIQGEIFWGGKIVEHALIYWGAFDKNRFIGVMLTSSPKHGNVPLLETHIKRQSNRGKNFEFQFRHTHIVNAKLIKEETWGPYRKVGELTEEGLMFINDYIKDKKPKYANEIPSFNISTIKRKR